MSSTELTPFSYEVLALVGRRGAAAYEVKQMAQRGRIFAWAGESQYYTEPKRLARLGYLDAQTEPGKTRPRPVYTLTGKGLEALRAWARTPARFPSLRHEALVRLLAADLVGEEAVREGLEALRDDLAAVEAAFEQGMRDIDSLPHRRKYLELGARLGRGWLELNRRWLDDVEKELS